MGNRHKLLLNWNGVPLLEHVLRAWKGSRVSNLLVVTRAEDTAIHSVCAHCEITTVCPSHDPADMKQSIQYGLRAIAASDRPLSHDRFLIAPADLPQLTAERIDQIIAASTGRDEIVVPRFGIRRGHPVSLPWRLAPKVFELAGDEGINRIVANAPVFHVDLPDAAAEQDVDTPADYRRLCDASAEESD